jgi:cell division protein FtsL
MRVNVRVGMVVAVVLTGSVFVVVIVPMFRPMIVIMALLVCMVLTVLMFMLVVMSAYAHRRFSGQSASAILTHQSISKEASSISRPARSSPLSL